MVKFDIGTKFAYKNKVYTVKHRIAGPTEKGQPTTVHHCVNVWDDNDKEQVNGSVVAEGIGLVVAEGLFPSGWGTCWSKTKKRPYYVHPDFGSTWYCPGLKSTTIHGYTRGEWDANKWSAKKDWTTSGDGSNLNISHMDIALPAKLDIPSDKIDDKCMERIFLHTGQVNGKQEAALKKTVDILLRDYKEANKDMPDNIIDILTNKLLVDGNYIFRKDIGFKCGDSADCLRRFNELVDGVKVTESNFNEHGYCLLPPSHYLSSGMVNQSTIDEILAIKDQPMLGGLHPDSYPIWVKKMLRQIVEFYVSCSYGFIPGFVLEWILRAPSEKERKMNDLDEINNAIQSQEDILQMLFNKTANGQVVDADTWITIQDQLAVEQSLEYFQDPHYQGLTEHLAKSNVNEEQYGGLSNMFDESPFYTKVMPTISALNDVLDRDNVSKEDTQPILDSMEEMEVYQEPDDEEHCLRGYEFIIKLDEKHTDEITRMRSATIGTLRSGNHGVTKDQFKQLFGSTIEFKGLKFVDTAEGIGVEEGVVLRIHQTKKTNNVIIERGSHYRALSPNARTVDRLNALYSHNYESVFMNKIGKLSNKSLQSILRRNLTRTMLIMGIDKQGTNEGNFWNALMYTLPNGVSDPGSKIGHKHLQSVIKLPIDLIYLMIWKVPEINKLLKLHGGKIRIDSTEQGRYYLRVSSESGDNYLTYYKQYDVIHSDDSVNNAINYINGVRGKPIPLLLGAVAETIRILYDSIDQEDFANGARTQFFNHRADQFLNKFKCKQDLLSEAFALFLPRASYVELDNFLNHVKYMDELSQDDKNKYVDSNGKGWLVLVGSKTSLVGRNNDRLREYLLGLMNKTGREIELMRKHLEMKGYAHMANREKYNEVMKMKESKSGAGVRVAASDAIIQGIKNPYSGGDAQALADELDNMYVAKAQD